jgi:hypothetical protein
MSGRRSSLRRAATAFLAAVILPARIARRTLRLFGLLHARIAHPEEE